MAFGVVTLVLIKGYPVELTGDELAMLSPRVHTGGPVLEVMRRFCLDGDGAATPEVLVIYQVDDYHPVSEEMLVLNEVWLRLRKIGDIESGSRAIVWHEGWWQPCIVVEGAPPRQKYRNAWGGMEQ